MSLRAEDIDQIECSALFDPDYYAAENPDVALSDLGPAEHYLHVGGALGRNPSAGFNGAAYLAIYLDVAARGDNPLLHFERHGRHEGRSPQPAAPGTVDETDAPVDIVIPVFNALEDVQSCLNSVASAPNSHKARVLVINDGSDATTSSWLREACATLGHETVHFQLIEHPENQGYTKAVNTGLKEATAPFVVTLNSDTIVTAHWLDGLVRCLQSDPRIGIVGPLSNAASWQNVPHLFDEHQAFAINTLPDGTTPDDMARVVQAASQRSYPRSSFVNGFCFMIRRAVLNAVGYMDEVAFPIGYGEENDFCIRAQDAGFALAYADDVYVYHAKSKSFGKDQRITLSEAGTEAIKQKHGADKFHSLLERAADTDKMDHVRHHIGIALTQGSASPAINAKDLITTQRILFILPVRGGGGGAHSVVQEVAAMRQLGVQAKIAVHNGDLDDYLQLYSDIENTRALFAPFTPETLEFVAGGYDVVVATIYSSVQMLTQIVDKMPWILPAYYAQDYEPFFYEEDSPEWQEACDSYRRIPGMFIFAKTKWICDTITQRHKVPMHKVVPSLDHSVYALEGPRVASASGTLCITAMIRPSTPRRGAARTMEVLAKLKAQFGADVTIRIFGCADDDADYQELRTDFALINHGILPRTGVAALLRGTDVFIDMSDYQAFGRTGLEAMACGALAVVPQAGGSDEYAVDGDNALIIDTFDVDTCVARVSAVLNDRATLAAMQLRGIETANRYSPRRAALSELSAFALALSTWRMAHPLPLDRPRLLLLPDLANNGTPTLPGVGNARLPRPYQQADFRARWNVITATNNELSPANGPDVAIIQNNARAAFGGDFEPWLHRWKYDGGRVIYDLNGDVYPRPDLDPALADAADVITVSGAAQREMVVQIHPTAAYKVIDVPTHLDADLWQTDGPALADSTPLQIGHFGTKSNRPDIEAINPALRAVQQKHDLEIKIVGTYEGSEPDFGERVSYPKMYHAPDMQQSDFIHWLSKVAKWDIVLLPDQGPLRQKFWQASALQGAIICRDAPDLYECARHAENCLLVGEDPAEWQAAIIRLIEDNDLRRSLARAARKDACTKWTQQANIELYDKVLEKAINGIQHIA